MFSYSIDKPEIKMIERNDVSVNINWEDENNFTKLIVVHPEKAKAISPDLFKIYKPLTEFDTSKIDSYTGNGNLVVYSGTDKTGSLKIKKTNPDTDYEVDFYYLNQTGKDFENKGKAQTLNFFTSALKPAKQARGVAYKGFTDKSADVVWKRGDGKKCIVLMKKGKGNLTPPENGKEYKASSEYGKGTSTDKDSTFAVFAGSGTEVMVENLEPNTLYTIKVFEYNGSGEKINYQSADAFLNPGLRLTMLETPILYKAENITATTFVAKWKKVSGGDVYELDMAYDKKFEKPQPDYFAVDVGNLSEYMFEELKPGKYYLRVRAFGNKNRSENSKPIEFELK